MKQTYTAVVKQDANWWIGWIEEVPGANCQEATREELLESLRITLAEAIEFNRMEARVVNGDRNARVFENTRKSGAELA